MGEFWTGIKKACVRATREKAPSLLVDMRVLADAASPGAKSLCRVVARGELAGSKDDLDPLLEYAVGLRAAASIAVGFLVVRRASEVGQLVTSDADPHCVKGVVNIRVVRAGERSSVCGPIGASGGYSGLECCLPRGSHRGVAVVPILVEWQRAERRQVLELRPIRCWRWWPERSLV